MPPRGSERTRSIVLASVGFALASGIGAAVAFARYESSWLGAFGTISRNAQNTSGYSFASRLSQLGLPHEVARIPPLVVLVIVGLYLALLGRLAMTPLGDWAQSRLSGDGVRWQDAYVALDAAQALALIRSGRAAASVG